MFDCILKHRVLELVCFLDLHISYTDPSLLCIKDGSADPVSLYRKHINEIL